MGVPNGASATCNAVGSNDVSSPLYLYTSADHTDTLLKSLKNLRESENLCDVILCRGEQEVPAHRVVLAGCSPYFNAMFNSGHIESRQRRVELNAIDGDTLESLVDFMYSACLEICEENVQNLLAGANLLELVPVVEACCEFLLVRLNPDNCLGIATFADMHGCTDLQFSSWRYALENFTDVAKSEEFLLCPPGLLAELIRSEDLVVKCEEEVLDGAIRWLKHDEQERSRTIHTILSHVKLPLIPWEYITSELLPIESVSDHPDCQVMLADVQRIQSSPELAAEGDISQCTPRKSVSQNRLIYAVGGETSPGRTTVATVERFDPIKNTWRELAPMATVRRGVGIGILNGLLYAIGGSDGVRALRLVECYDPVVDSWRRVGDMLAERSSVAAAVMSGYLFAVGGYDGIMSCLRSVERYDSIADRWEFVGEMNVARSMMSVGVLDNRLVAVGGYDGGADLSSCELYDPEVDRWAMIREMNAKRCMAGVAVLGGLLYAVGGCDCAQSLNSVEVFNPETAEWTLLAEMSEPRSGMGVAVVGRKLYAIGGYTGAGYCSSVECYDPETNSWEQAAEMRVGRRRFGCCS